MIHGFTCYCGSCAQAHRAVDQAARLQFARALHDAQRETRAYSWHKPYTMAFGAPNGISRSADVGCTK